MSSGSGRTRDLRASSVTGTNKILLANLEKKLHFEGGGMLIVSKISSNKSIVLDWNVRRADHVTVKIDTRPSPERHERRKVARKVLSDDDPRVDKGECQTGCRACLSSPNPP